jgi:hypothetical protein
MRPMKSQIKILYALLKSMAKHPRVFAQAVKTVPSTCEAFEFSCTYHDSLPEIADSNSVLSNSNPSNPLWEYFQKHKEGPGIWKWEHYFDIYHRHLAKFIGQKVSLLEIGIYSGGSLEMWRSYFGDNCHIYGVDIEKVCKSYENDHVSVFIGDQADRGFWSNFRNSVEGIDILIDDGGHTPEQQQITLEEMLPHLRPGGVYICEDVHGTFNGFAAFATGLVNNFNSMNCLQASSLSCEATQFQSTIHSIHLYPYVVVVEKRLFVLPKLLAPKHGTEWQPFL